MTSERLWNGKWILLKPYIRTEQKSCGYSARTNSERERKSIQVLLAHSWASSKGAFSSAVYIFNCPLSFFYLSIHLLCPFPLASIFYLCPLVAFLSHSFPPTFKFLFQPSVCLTSSFCPSFLFLFGFNAYGRLPPASASLTAKPIIYTWTKRASFCFFCKQCLASNCKPTLSVFRQLSIK